MTSGADDQDYERIPPSLDIGTSTYPRAVVTSSVPAHGFARLSWMHSETNGLPESPSTDSPDVLPSISPRKPKSRLSRQPIKSHNRGPVATMVPNPKATLQARGTFASEEQIHLKVHQSRRSAESSSSEGGVIHTMANTEEDVVEDHSGAGDLWWAPSRPTNSGRRGEKNSRLNLKVDTRSGPAFSHWQMRESQDRSKRWSLPL